MTLCDSCGRPIGHAEEIEGEYHSDDLDREIFWFGSRECKDEFENHHDVEEETECGECGKLVKKKEAVRDKVKNQTLGIIKERLCHESCIS